MQQFDAITALYLLAAFAIGGLSIWLMMKLWRRQSSITLPELEEKYVSKALYEQLQIQADVQRDDLMEKEESLRSATNQLAVAKSQIEDLQLRIDDREDRFQTAFENLSNRILEEKSQKFAAQNSEQVKQLLHPLREQIIAFDQGVRERFQWESQERVSLRKELEHLRQLNQQLSEDAHNLVNALKGDNKTQGHWGEWRLERLLAQAGLEPEIHYVSQPTYRDAAGNQKRPDYLIRLPQDKHLIIDCKVSLTAYERYINSQDESQQKHFLQEHVNSLRAHIRSLHTKNYAQLPQLQSPDYLLLFMPIDAAYVLAVRHDPSITEEALNRNIIMVTSTTLLVTLRTVSYVWKQEKQAQNAVEIARQSGLLYDKFCNFTEDLEEIGQRLNQAQNAYAAAFNKLVHSKKFGDTLVGRAEKIKELGADAAKQLPPHLLDNH